MQISTHPSTKTEDPATSHQPATKRANAAAGQGARVAHRAGGGETVVGSCGGRRCGHCSRPGYAATEAGLVAGATASVAENDRSTLGMACFGSESASSGQIRCQSSGRKSILVTAPPVACSMAAQCSIGIAPRIFQLPIAAAETPSRLASVKRPPASRAAVSSKCSDRSSIAVFISMTDFNTFSVFRSTPRDDISSIQSQIVKTIGERIRQARTAKLIARPIVNSTAVYDLQRILKIEKF